VDIMKILLVGATGRLGAAVGKALTGRGHQVVTVGRTGGDIRADVADPEQTARVFAQVSDVDAVASRVWVADRGAHADVSTHRPPSRTFGSAS
jgi:nucleoside-diphosphate-sugar epimerase